jgi:integrase
LNGQAKKRSWKNRTYNHYRLWLWQIFDFAVDNKLMAESENPFRTKKIKRRRPEAVLRRIPTTEQFEEIVEQVRKTDGEDYADFVEFLGSAGVGQAEAAGLEWPAIGAKIRFVRRKTGIVFEVPIYQWLAPLLLRLQAKRASKHVFNVSDAGKALRRACDALRFDRFTQRGLRAMLIKRLYDEGVPVKRIAQWQGHQDGGKLIQEIYTEVFSDNDAAAEEADLAKVGGAVDLTSAAQLVVVR